MQVGSGAIRLAMLVVAVGYAGSEFLLPFPFRRLIPLGQTIAMSFLGHCGKGRGFLLFWLQLDSAARVRVGRVLDSVVTRSSRIQENRERPVVIGSQVALIILILCIPTMSNY